MARIHASDKEPVCVVFAVDRSGSMGRKAKGNLHSTLSEVAAKLVNERIMDLALRSMKEPGAFRHYFDVGVFGYGYNPASGAESATALVPGQLGELGICDLPALASNPLRIEKHDEGPYPVWIDPAHKGRTPMCQVFDCIGSHLLRWTDAHPSRYPPMIVNISDGLVTDSPYEGATLETWVDRLSGFRTTTGVAKVFDLILSETQNPVLRPATVGGLTLPGWTVTQASTLLRHCAAISTWPSLSRLDPDGDYTTPDFVRRAELADDENSLSVTSERT
jgi:hypothetical protein